MKELINQFYNEGLATTFYLKPINFASKYIKNKKILNVIKILILILYTICAISLGFFILLKKLSWI